jgi:hypothetical protein
MPHGDSNAYWHKIINAVIANIPKFVFGNFFSRQSNWITIMSTDVAA